MKYDLVFEGGGAKGMVFVGACEEFFGRRHTFDRLLGTSTGPSPEACFGAGMKPKGSLEAWAEREEGRSGSRGSMVLLRRLPTGRSPEGLRRRWWMEANSRLYRGAWKRACIRS